MIVSDIRNQVLDWTCRATTSGNRNSYANTLENGLQQFDVAFSQAFQVLDLYSLVTRRKLGEESAHPVKDWHFFITDQDQDQGSDVHGEGTHKAQNVHDRMRDINVNDETVDRRPNTPEHETSFGSGRVEQRVQIKLTERSRSKY